MVNAEAFRNTAEILRFPKPCLPGLPDYARACRDLIRATFPAPSQHGTCLLASAAIGASPDTFDRILSGLTKKPDGYLMQCVLVIAAARGVAVPPALAVRGAA